MGLFDKKVCVCCGKETGRLPFVFKEDKQCLCKKCVEKLPDGEFRDYAKKFWTSDYFKTSYLPFLKECEGRRKAFQLKAWYGAIFIDEKNRMFCYSPDMAFLKTTEIPENTPIFKFDDISKESCLYFEEYERKEGMFSTVSKGDIKLRLDCDDPKFYFEGAVRSDLTVKNKKNNPFYNLPDDYYKAHDLFCILLGREELISPDRRK